MNNESVASFRFHPFTRSHFSFEYNEAAMFKAHRGMKHF